MPVISLLEGENSLSDGLTVGIDASNLRRGGGVTHLVEILRAADPGLYGISRVVVFGGSATLSLVESRPWLVKRCPPSLNRGLLARLFWQRFCLTRIATQEGCGILFVPGGSFACKFKPVVTMSRNMLPFETQEMNRYGCSLMGLKLRLLKLSQTHSLRAADGVIFLTEYAKNKVSQVTGTLKGFVEQIPHGLDSRFLAQAKQQRTIQTYDEGLPYQLLYVSIIDQYKHQWCVVEAVAALRKKGFPLRLNLVGPAYPPALKKLQKSIMAYDPDHTWVRYHGAVNYQKLHHIYAQADLGIFASSCENMPNILLETMASGLPVAASCMGPTPEVLGNAGVYFDPTRPDEIANAIETLLLSPELRLKKAQDSFIRAQQFSWQRCANETFKFLAKAAKQHSFQTHD